MSVDAGITSSTRQILVLAIWDMEMRLRIAVFLGKTEVNDIDLVSALANSHQKVVRFDVPMNEGFGVNVFDTGNELICQEQDGLQREFAVAEVKQILQAGPEEVQDHGVVVTFCAEPSNERNTNTSSKGLVDTGLIFELWMLGLDALEFDSNLLSGNDIGT